MSTPKYNFGCRDIATILGLSTLFGSKWEPRTFDISFSAQEASAFGNFGDILIDGGTTYPATSAFNRVISFNASLCVMVDACASINFVLGKKYVATTPLSDKFGASVTDLILTQCGVNQPAAGFAILTFGGHLHTPLVSTRAHIERKYTVALPVFGFGVQGIPECIEPTTPAPTISLTDFTSINFSAEVQHTDELDRSGTFLIGASHTCKHSYGMSLVNNSDGMGALTAAAGWTGPLGDGLKSSNTGYDQRDGISFVKYFAVDV